MTGDVLGRTPGDSWDGPVAGELDPLDDLDLQTLATLRGIWEATDPVPAGLGDRAKFAMTVAALEAEVAEIAAGTLEAAGVRATAYDRATTITFSSDTLSAMITIEVADASSARVSGWVTSGRTHVELRERAKTQETTADEAGRFTFASVERGLAHLVMRRLDDPDARPVITPAIEI